MNLRQPETFALDSLDSESHCSEAENFIEKSHTADPERTKPIKKVNNFAPSEDTCSLLEVNSMKTHNIFCNVSGFWQVLHS